VLTSAATSLSGTTIAGTLQSVANTTFRIEFFANATADPSGYGQGQTFLGYVNVTTDGTGHASFTASGLVLPAGQQFVSATATNLTTNDTSQFANDLAIPIASAGGPYAISEGNSLTLNGSGSSDPAGGPLTYSWDVNGDGVFGDATGVTPTLTWSQLEALAINDGPATFPVSVKVTNAQGNSTISPATTLTVNDVPVSNLSLALAASAITEGGSASLSGSFTNPSAVDAHTLVINWGDSSATTTVNLPAGVTIFSGISHQYLEESAGQAGGTYSISVTVSDNEGGQASAQTSIQVNDAALSDRTATTAFSATEGAGTGDWVVGTFADADPNASPADYYHAVISWGDGTYSAASAIILSGGTFLVLGSHTYAEEGTYHPYAVVTDNEGNPSLTTGRSSVTTSQTLVTVFVADAALSDRTAATTFSATEGAGTGDQVVGTFADADPNAGPGDYTATIFWGDGTSSAASAIPGSGGTFNVHGSHTYAEEGTYHPFAVVTDNEGNPSLTTGRSSVTTSQTLVTVFVADAALSDRTAATTFSATEGAGTGDQVVGTFADADPNASPGDYTAVVSWGDGTYSAASAVTLSGGTFSVHGSHTYGEEGTYHPSALVTDNEGNPSLTTGRSSVTTSQTLVTVTVADAGLSDRTVPTAISATEGAGTGDQVVGTFADADPNASPGDYTAVIYWGDSTSSAASAITLSGGTFSVHGSHTYGEEGTYHPYAVVTDNEGNPSLTSGRSSVTTSTTLVTVTVADAALTATNKAVTPITGSAFTGVVASFTDADPAGTATDYTATITWGDGHTSPGTVSANGSGGFNVTGTNTYAADGVFAFTVTIKDAGGSSVTANSTAYVGGVAKTLSVTSTTAATAGTPFAVTVKALDAAGNPAYNYTGTVSFTSTDAKAVLPANYTFGAVELGTHVFSVTLKTAASQSVTATDTANGAITGKQGGITVAAAAVSQFSVVSKPGSQKAGMAVNVTVTAQDAFGNPVTGYARTVHLTSTDAQAVLPADYTFTAADAGMHVFSVTLKTAGSQTVTVTDKASGTVTGTSGPVTVTPAAAVSFVFISAPSSASKGTAFSFTVKAVDAYGNVDTGYLGTVHFTSSDTLAGLPADYTFTAANAGVATFTATLNTVGVQSLTVTDTHKKSITGTTSITVS
jgi:hypothetical protein